MIGNGSSLDVASVSYDAFGNPTYNESQVGTFRNFYAGREYDDFTGLYYNRARWYDPQAARFISQDPISFAGGDTNLYRYAGNSPDNATDPSGQAANIVVGAGIGAVVGGAGYALNSWWYGTEFNTTDFLIATGAGAVAGAVAGATFGASLAVSSAGVSALGLTGTTASVATASATLGLTGAAAGASGGFIAGGGMGLNHGEDFWTSATAGAQQGAFYGGVSGLVAGAGLPIAANLAVGAGLTGGIGGGLALSGSLALGDVAAQGLSNVLGMQEGYNPFQTLLAGAGGFIGGRCVGGRDTAIGVSSGRPGLALATFKSGFRTLIPEVVAEATVGGRVFRDTNPLARLGSVRKPTLISERVTGKTALDGRGRPNGNMGTAHGEVGSIQQAADAGLTFGGDMVMRVFGRRVCDYCKGDIPAAAQAAGLRSLVVVEEVSGTRFNWRPGMTTLRE